MEVAATDPAADIGTQGADDDVQSPVPEDFDPVNVPNAPDDPTLHDEDEFSAHNGSNARGGEESITAFAKLEFGDGDFYMTTHAVLLGRDVRVPLDPKEARRKRSWNSGPSGGERKRHKSHRHHTSSVVSESGGIIGADIFDKKDGKTAEEKPVNAESASSSQYVRDLSSQSSFATPRKDYNHETRELEAFLDEHGNDNIDPSAERIPLIPIHPPARSDGRPAGQQGISRKHMKIFFNFAENVFQITFIGINGGFVDDEWFASGETETLVSGSIVLLKGLWFTFKLPNVADGETGAGDVDFADGSEIPTWDQNGSEIEDMDSLDENGYGYARNGGGGSEESEDENEDEDEEEDEEEEEDDREREVLTSRRKTKPMSKVVAEQEPEQPKAKRKGPGRPPKNGIMSKREQAQQAREAKENAKAKADKKASAAQGRGKGKTAKALELEASHLQPNGKRKYTKRKKATEVENAKGIRESTERDESAPPETTTKPAKDKKPIKPPRSPSPVFNEAELTQEQLAKPQSSYVVLIHEALTNSKTGHMSLPQIYRAIERRYPFFKLRVQTQGWQSSVRHNLSQHAAFTKIERDGKGWMWGLVPSVSIEKEKKRRPSPPAAPQQNYQYSSQQPRYPQHPHPYPYGNLPAQGRSAMPFPYPVPPIPFPPQLGQNGIPIPFVRPQSESTYRSPYDSNPSTTQAASSAITPSTPAPAPINAPYPSSTSQPPLQQSSISTSATTPSAVRNGSQTQPFVPNTAPRYSEEVLTRVNDFKTALIKTLDQIPDPETLVTSVINHKLYGQPLNADPGSNAAAILKPLEDIILAGVRGKVPGTALTGSGDVQTSTKSLDGASEEDTVAGKAAVIARKIQTEDTGGAEK